MAWYQKIKRQRSGEVIEAKTLADTAEAAEFANKIRANPPLAIAAGAGGPLLRLAGMLFSVYIVVAHGAITARSGTTPGTGLATIQTWNGTVLASLSIDFTVKNISSTTGGIPDGTYGIMLRICGAYWFITVDCGN